MKTCYFVINYFITLFITAIFGVGNNPFYFKPMCLKKDELPRRYFGNNHLYQNSPNKEDVRKLGLSYHNFWSNYKHYFKKNGSGYPYGFNDVVKYYKMLADLTVYWKSTLKIRFIV